MPELVIDLSKDLTSPIANVMDADAVDTVDIDVDDTTYLSEGSTAIFPCTIRYMDLTFLQLKHLNRVPHLMLIRDEWRTVVHIFNKRRRGIQGSTVFTGQPGTGEHRYCS